MKKFSVIMLFIASISTSLLAQAQTSITVKNVEDFIASIASNRIIVLKEGVYDLTKIKTTRNKVITLEKVYDGVQIVITGVQNLKIIGEGNVEIITTPRYANVLSFTSCKKITLQNLYIYHTDTGACTGSVLKFLDVQELNLTTCYLEGCGTTGIELIDVTTAVIDSCEVFNCSQGAVYVENGYNIQFYACVFYDNNAEPLLNVASSEDVSFDGCEIKTNTGSGIFTGEYNTNISITNCYIYNNSVEAFDTGNIPPNVDGNQYEDNAFYSDEESAEGYYDPGYMYETWDSGIGLSLDFDSSLWTFYQEDGLYIESYDALVKGYFIDIDTQKSSEKSATTSLKKALNVLNDFYLNTNGKSTIVETDSLFNSGDYTVQVVHMKFANGINCLSAVYEYNNQIYILTFTFASNQAFSDWEDSVRVLMDYMYCTEY